ncbi:P-loop containing nucleoside triphosphate hydrolase protein [Apiosordaria backusii]|uniref:P-loop containing nucleoside triphosphate hydrolase protein n=1 Tax=Apiosordaria backusii TaxID=314023 RepID=A0AA40BRP7_9PEZI|nr:P-loop containing nucleoside triphosphate hydrolase protein [Apiosordaria backusii]
MASDDTLPTLKVLLIGPSGAGKSALLTRYCDDEFDPETSAATIGIDFKIKVLNVRGKPYRLTLFDTAGQERFRTLSTSFYRGAHGVLLVYDISTRASFLSMERWFNEAEANTVEGVALYLVGAKLDKADGPDGGREVTTEEGQALAEAHGAKFCEASAKTRENVRLPFVDIVDRIVQTPGLIENARLGRAAGAVALGNNAGGGYGAYFPGGCSC